jgi:hypothetical protein
MELSKDAKQYLLHAMDVYHKCRVCNELSCITAHKVPMMESGFLHMPVQSPSCWY